ncbi:MAG: right-handed parallel beta-helix repeat-containing protein [bacterium]
MAPAPTTVESVHVHPAAGCGTIDAPWTGWERQIEAGLFGGPRAYLFGAGFWATQRPVRLGSGVSLGPADPGEGRPWFLPADDVDSIFRIDGSHDVALHGICLEGRAGRAAHGVLVRCGTRIEIRGCRFDDFTARKGAAILVAGESSDRWVRGLVIETCTFLHGATALRLDRDVSDLLVADNRFEEFTEPAVVVDPRDRWVDYGLIFVKNRLRSTATDRDAPLVRVLAGAENLRLAENVFEGPEHDAAPRPDGPAAIEVRGGGPSNRRRLEVLLNAMAGIRGPAIEARHCGSGFVACGNRVSSCGTSKKAAIDLTACHGVLIEDNEIRQPRGPALRFHECQRTRANGNDVQGPPDGSLPRSGGPGVFVEGEGTRRVRISDNRVSGMKEIGVLVTGGVGLRLVGNEVKDCGEGIRVRSARGLVLVGNDCRDNGAGGIHVETDVRRGLVALNHAILNGPVDFAVHGQGIRCRDNKVEYEE